VFEKERDGDAGIRIATVKERLEMQA